MQRAAALQWERERLVCSVAATASPLGGNVRAVALYQPSGEQPLRAPLRLHLMAAPRWLTHAWRRRVARASVHRIMCAQLMHAEVTHLFTLSVVTSELIFSRPPYQVAMSRSDTLCCLCIDSALTNAFTSNMEHHLDSIDRGSTWGQANRACLG